MKAGLVHRRDDLRNTVVVAAGLVVATALMLRAVIETATHAIPGELRDPLLNTWILAWDSDHLRHGLTGVWDMPILYPYHSTLAFSEHLLGIAIFAAPIEWLTRNPVLAYNTVFFASFVFAGLSMFLLARALTGRTDAAVIAAAIYAFCPYRMAQVSHLQLLVNGWMPLSLLGLHRYFATGSRTALAAGAVAYWLLAMSNGYYLFFFGLVVVLVIARGVWNAGAARSRLASEMAVAALVLGAAYAPIAREYFTVRHEYGLSRDADEVRGFSADVGSYLTMPDQMRSHLHLTLPSYPKPAGPEERHDGMLFPGFLMIALAAVAVARRQTRRMSLTRLYGGIAVAAFVLSLGPEPTVWGHRLMSSGPYAWLDALVPVLDALRVPARFASIVDLALTVLAAIGAASMLGSLQQTKAALAVTAALVVLACFEGYGPIPIAEVGPRGYTRDFGLYEWLRNQPPGAVVELPIGRLDGHYRGFVYEYNTLVHRHPVVNGWTGYTTDLQQFLGSDASPLRHRDQLSDGLDLLRGLHVRYLIVHPDDFDPRDNAAPILNGLIADPSRWTAMKQFGAAFVFTLPAEADAPRGPPLDRLAPATIRVNVSHSPDRLPFLFDGDIDTRWTTGAAQDGSEWIELRFDRTVDVRRLRFEVQPRNFRDYPRILEVAAIDGGGAVPLFQGSVLMAFGRGLRLNQMRVPIDVDLPSHPTRAIRIAQKGRVDGIWWWSIDELTVMVVGH